ncbi:hypothetical protein, partial [Phaeobacter sp. SYSU ZJ3003]|uniref:hypothetical protein n=1 Tax=Phaeobacter sp. SYSU ZJ3003 TaxID=2109330 RepID=UPI00351CAE8E
TDPSHARSAPPGNFHSIRDTTLATTAREWDSFNMISADGPFAGPLLLWWQGHGVLVFEG